MIVIVMVYDKSRDGDDNYSHNYNNNSSDNDDDNDDTYDHDNGDYNKSIKIIKNSYIHE